MSVSFVFLLIIFKVFAKHFSVDCAFPMFLACSNVFIISSLFLFWLVGPSSSMDIGFGVKSRELVMYLGSPSFQLD